MFDRLPRRDLRLLPLVLAFLAGDGSECVRVLDVVTARRWADARNDTDRLDLVLFYGKRGGLPRPTEQ